MLTLRTYAALALPLALAGAAVTASPALASGGDAVRASGTCSSGSSWSLKAAKDDGRLQVELEVDSNRAGQSWSWRLTDDGVLVARGAATTVAPSGSFTRERRIADRAGTDVVRLRAVRAGGGETCTGMVRI